MNLTDLKHRESDKHVFGESRRDYKQLLIPVGSKVLDLGAHIGSFVYNMAIRDTEAEFLCVEPSPDSYKLLQENIVLIETAFPKVRVKSIHAAVVKDTLDGKIINIYERSDGSTRNTIIPTKGRISTHISGVGISRLCTEFQPTIVKCDIEGAEYDILPVVSQCKTVIEIAVEFHRFGNFIYHNRAVAVHNFIVSQCFTTIRPPVFGPKNWTTIGLYHKE